MKAIALAVFAAAALVSHVTICAPHSLIPSNASISGLDRVEPRRLEVLPTVDKICESTDALGYRQLYLAQYNEGAVYARCDTKKKPKCYLDDGVIDRPPEHAEVDCAKALEIIKKIQKKKSQRRLGLYTFGVKPWPNGVVCYNFMNTHDPALMEQYNANKVRVHKMIKSVMAKYTKGTNKAIRFMHITSCKPTAGHCNGCTHFVNFEFEVKALNAAYTRTVSDVTRHDCWSQVGYVEGSSEMMVERGQLDEDWKPVIKRTSLFMQFLERRRIVNPINNEELSYQPINLSPSCWNPRSIAHEIGHTLGLIHEHQRSDRRILIKQNRITRENAWEFKIQPLNNEMLCGDYDVKSIMHYHDDRLCLPRDGLETDIQDFCDAGQPAGTMRPGRRQGCVTGAEAHCAEVQTDLERPTTYLPSAGDYRAIKEFYAGRCRATTAPRAA